MSHSPSLKLSNWTAMYVLEGTSIAQFARIVRYGSMHIFRCGGYINFQFIQRIKGKILFPLSSEYPAVVRELLHIMVAFARPICHHFITNIFKDSFIYTRRYISSIPCIVIICITLKKSSFWLLCIERHIALLHSKTIFYIQFMIVEEESAAEACIAAVRTGEHVSIGLWDEKRLVSGGCVSEV